MLGTFLLLFHCFDSSCVSLCGSSFSWMSNKSFNVRAFFDPWTRREASHRNRPRLSKPLVASFDNFVYASSRMLRLLTVSSARIANLRTTAAVVVPARARASLPSQAVRARTISKRIERKRKMEIRNDGLEVFLCSRIDNTPRAIAVTRPMAAEAMATCEVSETSRDFCTRIARRMLLYVAIVP